MGPTSLIGILLPVGLVLLIFLWRRNAVKPVLKA